MAIASTVTVLNAITYGGRNAIAFLVSAGKDKLIINLSESDRH
ncbi:hypothetical protein [Nostoc sp. FACHB-110]|nr:hypothetical protein [Nostoc sp. FACHB-110]